MPMKKVQIRLPDPDREYLEAVAKERKITLSDLIRRLLSKAIREKHHEQV